MLIYVLHEFSDATISTEMPPFLLEPTPYYHLRQLSYLIGLVVCDSGDSFVQVHGDGHVVPLLHLRFLIVALGVPSSPAHVVIVILLIHFMHGLVDVTRLNLTRTHHEILYIDVVKCLNLMVHPHTSSRLEHACAPFKALIVHHLNVSVYVRYIWVIEFFVLPSQTELQDIMVPEKSHCPQ